MWIFIAACGIFTYIGAKKNKIIQDQALENAELQGRLADYRRDVMDLCNQVSKYTLVVAELEARVVSHKNDIIILNESLEEVSKNAHHQSSPISMNDWQNVNEFE
jgi:peptidoglycan hydrolase CwlO-like protein